jgi:hypothetical protein
VRRVRSCKPISRTVRARRGDLETSRRHTWARRGRVPRACRGRRARLPVETARWRGRNAATGRIPAARAAGTPLVRTSRWAALVAACRTCHTAKGTHAAARGGARSSGPLAAHASRGLRSLRPWVDRSIYCQLDAEGRLSRTWRQMDHMRRTFADTSRALSRRGSDCCKSPPPPRTSYCCHEMEQDGRGMNGWWRRSRSPSSTQRGGPGGLQPSRVGVGARGSRWHFGSSSRM